jgi:signal recognition particle GTPase
MSEPRRADAFPDDERHNLLRNCTRLSDELHTAQQALVDMKDRADKAVALLGRIGQVMGEPEVLFESTVIDCAAIDDWPKLIDAQQQELAEERERRGETMAMCEQLQQELADERAAVEALSKTCKSLEKDREYNAGLVTEMSKALAAKEVAAALAMPLLREMVLRLRQAHSLNMCPCCSATSSHTATCPVVALEAALSKPNQ